MSDKRPINLNLLTIRFPIPAIISILHRISGVILFLFIPFLLWLLHFSLSSAQNFNQLAAIFDNAWVKIITFGLIASLSYHLIAGIRHMIMDLGFAEDIENGKRTAYAVLVIAVIITLYIAGKWL